MKHIFFIALSTLFIIQTNAQSRYEYRDTYKIKIPEYMREMQGLNEEASLQVGNPVKEVYTIVLDENKAEIIEFLSSQSIYDINSSPLENYSFMMQSYYEEGIENYNLISEHNFTSGKNFGKTFTFTGTFYNEDLYSNLNVFYYITYIEGRKNLFQIMSWSLEKNHSKYSNDLKNIGKTLVEDLNFL